MYVANCKQKATVKAVLPSGKWDEINLICEPDDSNAELIKRAKEYIAPFTEEKLKDISFSVTKRKMVL